MFLRKIFLLVLISFLGLESNAQGIKTGLQLLHETGAGNFTICAKNKVTSLLCDSNDAKVVRQSTSLFAEDIKMVSGNSPAGYNELRKQPLIVIETIGMSRFVDPLVKSGSGEY